MKDSLYLKELPLTLSYKRGKYKMRKLIMKLFPVLLFGLFSSLGLSQGEATSKIYWNSLSTAVNVGVPLADDASLKGGRIQIRISFDGGKNFSNLGIPTLIEKKDIDNLKDVSIPGELFESMKGYKEGSDVHFIAEIWDKAGNSIVSDVSDSILTIDETIPRIEMLEIISSNALGQSFAMPGDSITFQLKTSEPIDPPIFEINGDEFESIGNEKTWMTVYPADEADDGEIKFKVIYSDYAQNPGELATASSNGNSITMDGTIPELDNVVLFSSNQYDSTLAVKGDTVFLQFEASETVRDIEVKLDLVESSQIQEDSLTFTFYHVFTESDSEGVIPITIDFTDFAGNIGEQVTETTDDSEITFDRTPPATFIVGTVGSLMGEIEMDVETALDSSSVTSNSMIGISEIPKLYLFITAGLLGFFCLLIWISWYMIFSKAGEAGWKALVPFFNLFVFTKIIQKPIWWIGIYLILPVGWIMAALQISKVFDKKIIFAIGLIIFPFVFYPILAFGKSALGKKQVEPVPEPKTKKAKKKKK